MRLQQGLRGVTAAAVVLGFVCPSAAAQTRQPSRTVLSIHWGSESDPSTGRLDAAIQGALMAHSDAPVDYFAEYLETEEFPAETASTALRDYILRKYVGRHIDVVIAVASAALQFTLRYRKELFPDVPIVFLAVALPQAVLDRSVPNITGVLNDTPFSETLELALRLQPTARHVFVVAHAPTVAGYDDKVKSALRRFSDRVTLTYVEDRTIPALLSAVKAIPPPSLILYTRYAPDEPAPNVHPDDIARLIAGVSRVPIYGVSDLYIGSGVVGGVIRTSDGAGTRLGQIARQILDGTSPGDIPTGSVSTVPMFDWREVKHWRLDVSTLPPGSRILFRTPTMWEAYRWYVVGTFAVVGLQLALIAGLLTQRARRRRAEQIIRTRETSLRKSYDQIRLLAGRLINAQETARASLAQDLHDDICQRLAMVSTAIDSLKTSSGDIQNAKTQRLFAALARDAHGTFEVVRALSHDLHPATLRVLGLVPALKTHCREVAKRHNVEVIFTTQGDFPYVPDDVAVCFFRVAQESLRNGVEHGEANRVTVSLTRSGDDLEMTVTDNGCGFNFDAVSREGSGVGVISMEERARAIGGTLFIVSGGQHGTAIRIKAPIHSPQPVSVPDVSGPTAIMRAAARSPVTS
ncbi:MAG TPA: ABC transporter substrate binding protein [Vicinamibacterales bacterium]|nr:ABC transporter substrate binding protein [Vicinamibacterales bacterium]